MEKNHSCLTLGARPSPTRRLVPMFTAQIIALALVAATTLLTPSPASAQASDGPVTVVISISKRDGANASEARALADRIREMVRKQPGLRSEEMAANINPDNEPNFVHVMHWDSMKAWEGLFLSPHFAEATAKIARSISYSAVAFRPLP